MQYVPAYLKAPKNRLFIQVVDGGDRSTGKPVSRLHNYYGTGFRLDYFCVCELREGRHL